MGAIKSVWKLKFKKKMLWDYEGVENKQRSAVRYELETGSLTVVDIYLLIIRLRKLIYFTEWFY